MKILISTQETQGHRDNDFCFVPEGEIVAIGITCDHDKNDPDGNCGCYRDFTGAKCKLGTTTAKVINTSMLFDEYLNIIRNFLYDLFDGIIEPDDSDVYDLTYKMLGIASLFSRGSVIEKRGKLFKRRK